MQNYSRIEEICRKQGAEYKSNAPLAPLTTFKIGGACDALAKINSVDTLQLIVRHCKDNSIPYHIIGNGSNLLVRDKGVRGVVLLMGSDFAKISTGGGGKINCEAGVSLSTVCAFAREAVLTGLEFAYGIPGTIGGAIYMNAGAYDGDVSKVLRVVKYLDEDGRIKTLEPNEKDFGYRKSPFTGTKKVIVSTMLELKHGNKEQIVASMETILRKRKNTQPLEFPSAGSTFKRPVGDYASRLIDVCDLKGFSVGGAQVSEKHAGFIINTGGATCDDVLALIETVKERVFEQTGYTLEKEVKVLG
jgi:UDP-N-acetylmuramate dehydrogenase